MYFCTYADFTLNYQNFFKYCISIHDSSSLCGGIYRKRYTKDDSDSALTILQVGGGYTLDLNDTCKIWYLWIFIQRNENFQNVDKNKNR